MGSHGLRGQSSSGSMQLFLNRFMKGLTEEQSMDIKSLDITWPMLQHAPCSHSVRTIMHLCLPNAGVILEGEKRKYTLIG